MSDVVESIVNDAVVELFIAFGVAIRPVSGVGGALRSGAPASAPQGPSSTREPPSTRGSAPTSSRQDDRSAGLISLEGPGIRGTLLMVSSFDFIAGSRPKELRTRPLSSRSAGDWLYVRDWSKELVNQLLGRIKRRLSVHGVSFEGRMPTALTGEAVLVALGNRAEAPLRFVAGASEVLVWFNPVLSPAAEQLLLRRQPQQFVREGEIIVF